MNPADAITSVATTVGKIADVVKVREERANTTEMKANAEKRSDQEIRDETNQALAAGDLDTLRKLNS